MEIRKSLFTGLVGCAYLIASIAVAKEITCWDLNKYPLKLESKPTGVETIRSSKDFNLYKLPDKKSEILTVVSNCASVTYMANITQISAMSTALFKGFKTPMIPNNRAAMLQSGDILKILKSDEGNLICIEDEKMSDVGIKYEWIAEVQPQPLDWIKIRTGNGQVGYAEKTKDFYKVEWCLACAKAFVEPCDSKYFKKRLQMNFESINSPTHR